MKLLNFVKNNAALFMFCAAYILNVIYSFHDSATIRGTPYILYFIPLVPLVFICLRIKSMYRKNVLVLRRCLIVYLVLDLLSVFIVHFVPFAECLFFSMFLVECVIRVIDMISYSYINFFKLIFILSRFAYFVAYALLLAKICARIKSPLEEPENPAKPINWRKVFVVFRVFCAVCAVGSAVFFTGFSVKKRIDQENQEAKRIARERERIAGALEFNEGRGVTYKNFDKRRYKEVSFYDLKNEIESVKNKGNYSVQYFKTKCHFINSRHYYNGQILEFYSDKNYFQFSGRIETNSSGLGDFPDDMPPFTPLELYYSGILKKNFRGDSFEFSMDGWRVVDDVRFVGQKYIAIGKKYIGNDFIRVHSEPNLSEEKNGYMQEYGAATVLEVGEKMTIDGIESAVVKVLTEDGIEGWCFAGYLTDGIEYREKPWTSKAE